MCELYGMFPFPLYLSPAVCIFCCRPNDIRPVLLSRPILLGPLLEVFHLFVRRMISLFYLVPYH